MCAEFPGQLTAAGRGRTRTGMTTLPMNRVHKGVPTGGQFAATAHAESGLSLGGRHEAPTSNRHVPPSLRMAHFQDPALTRDLEWAVENSIGDADDEMDYRCDSFCDQLPNLQYEEAVRYFARARNVLADGGNWKTVIEEAAAVDTACHPGGSMKDGYVPPVVSHQRGYGQGTLSTGSKYTGYRDATGICKDIRAELKAATAANYLPAGLTYSVTSEKFSGGQAINVRIQGVSDEDRIDRTELDHRGEYAQRSQGAAGAGGGHHQRLQPL
jgi:hypothetical protein